jgi:hypothetical protein
MERKGERSLHMPAKYIKEPSYFHANHAQFYRGYDVPPFAYQLGPLQLKMRILK